jgi:hypothetical protein
VFEMRKERTELLIGSEAVPGFQTICLWLPCNVTIAAKGSISGSSSVHPPQGVKLGTFTASTGLGSSRWVDAQGLSKMSNTCQMLQIPEVLSSLSLSTVAHFHLNVVK